MKYEGKGCHDCETGDSGIPGIWVPGKAYLSISPIYCDCEAGKLRVKEMELDNLIKGIEQYYLTVDQFKQNRRK